MASEMTAPILSYEDINSCAEEFLKMHGRGATLPVDIEAIAEFDLVSTSFRSLDCRRRSM